VVVLGLELDMDAMLAAYDCHLFAPLDPDAEDRDDPIADLVPAHLDLTHLKARDAATDCGLQSGQDRQPTRENR
jgi:hypothetical protein